MKEQPLTVLLEAMDVLQAVADLLHHPVSLLYLVDYVWYVHKYDSCVNIETLSSNNILLYMSLQTGIHI